MEKEDQWKRQVVIMQLPIKQHLYVQDDGFQEGKTRMMNRSLLRSLGPSRSRSDFLPLRRRVERQIESSGE